MNIAFINAFHDKYDAVGKTKYIFFYRILMLQESNITKKATLWVASL